jgi:hypothetical protein
MFYVSVYSIEIALWWQKHLFWARNDLVLGSSESKQNCDFWNPVFIL